MPKDKSERREKKEKKAKDVSAADDVEMADADRSTVYICQLFIYSRPYMSS